MNRTTFKTAVFVIAGVLLLQTVALAGPPLICHPFNIGDARSLPFRGPAWSNVDPGYDIKRLLEDTTSLLAADTPVIVRMETLRRATLYARTDGKLASELFERIKSRAAKFSADNTNREALLAKFDAAYLAETYNQAVKASKSSEAFWQFKQASPDNTDGYSVVKKLIAQGGGPEMEFAAAVIASDKRELNYHEHVQRAMAGAKPGSLLAQNLASHFPDDMKSARLDVK